MLPLTIEHAPRLSTEGAITILKAFSNTNTELKIYGLVKGALSHNVPIVKINTFNSERYKCIQYYFVKQW